MLNHKQFIYRPGGRTRLKDHDPGFTGNFADEGEARESMQADCDELARYQDILMAHETHGLLILFQAMDGAGKDSTIKHVMSSVDPQGCEVKMFKKPTEKDARHDYLWRAACGAPARGQIGIFNRSYYEHVLAERVHPERLERQKLPAEVKDAGIWKRRYRHINNFEQYLFENGIHVLKFFLHMSKAEQRERLLERIARPDKKWKFSASDIEERGLWDEYMRTYEDVLKHTATRRAPWYVVPADRRWFARAAVASIVAAKLKSLHSRYPATSGEEKKELTKAQQALEKESASRRK